MPKLKTLNRRRFLHGQTALLGLGVCGAAQAVDFERPAASFSERFSWNAGTAAQFSQLVNQRFTAFGEDGQMYHLKLTSVTGSGFDKNRPRSLKRSESISLIFTSVVGSDLSAAGHQNMGIRHPKLGGATVFTTTIPRKDGSFELEVIFN